MDNTENKFKHEGVWYIAVEEDSCRGCALKQKIGTCTLELNFEPACNRLERKDDRNVIFVKSDADNFEGEE